MTQRHLKNEATTTWDVPSFRVDFGESRAPVLEKHPSEKDPNVPSLYRLHPPQKESRINCGTLTVAARCVVPVPAPHNVSFFRVLSVNLLEN